MSKVKVASMQDYGMLVLRLSEAPSTIWVDAFRRYLLWARGVPLPDGVTPEQPPSESVAKSRITVTGDILTIGLPTGVSYAEGVQEFVEERAIPYANAADDAATPRANTGAS